MKPETKPLIAFVVGMFLLFGVAVFIADQIRRSDNAKKEKFADWPIVCDGKGQFSFVTPSGDPIGIYTNRADAVSTRDYCKFKIEQRDKGIETERPENKISWKVCNDYRPAPAVPIPTPEKKDKTFNNITWATTNSPAVLALSTGATTTSMELNPNWQSASISIACGKGYVSIRYGDGKVTYNDCTPDEAAKGFWKAVSENFEGARRAIIEGAKRATP